MLICASLSLSVALLSCHGLIAQRWLGKILLTLDIVDARTLQVKGPCTKPEVTYGYHV